MLKYNIQYIKNWNRIIVLVWLWLRPHMKHLTKNRLKGKINYSLPYDFREAIFTPFIVSVVPYMYIYNK
jgi:hypothetical protein